MTSPRCAARWIARCVWSATTSGSPRRRDALAQLAASPADAIVLDVAMPGIDGLEVCRRLREAGDRTPVLMLTARETVDDRVAGLDAGADDYLVKPFALRELHARLRALLRRTDERTGDGVLRFADLSLDPVDARSPPGGALDRADAHRVRAAQPVPRAPAPGAHAVADLRAGLGLRLRRDIERARRLRRATCAARPRPAASRGCCTRCAVSATRCGKALVPLRRRIGLLTALAVGITVLVASVITYVVVRDELHGQVDDALTAQADRARDVARAPPGFRGPTAGEHRPCRCRHRRWARLRRSRSSRPTAPSCACRRPRSRCPSPPATVPSRLASRAFFSERVAEGTQLRVYTFSPRRGVAVQLSRSLNGTNNVLKRLRLVLRRRCSSRSPRAACSAGSSPIGPCARSPS